MVEQNLTDPTFNISGWNSSYTGSAIPEWEMPEWLDDTVERILKLGPNRVLEIGCGSGMLLFRIAPQCIEYRGTDISSAASAAVGRHVDVLKLGGKIQLERRRADDFDRLAAGSYDTVILNCPPGLALPVVGRAPQPAAFPEPPPALSGDVGLPEHPRGQP